MNQKPIYNFIRDNFLLSIISILIFVFSLPAIATDLPDIGGNGGTPFRLLCPAGSFLSGFDGRSGAWIDRLRLICSPWDTQKNELGDSELVPRNVGLSRGGRPKQVLCPAQLLVWGAKFDTLSSDNALLDEFSFECTFFKDPGFKQQRLDFSSTDDKGFFDNIPLGQKFAGSSGWLFCPKGELAVGIYGRSGDYIDRIGLVCDVTPTEAQARFQKRFLYILGLLGIGVVLLLSRRQIHLRKP